MIGGLSRVDFSPEWNQLCPEWHEVPAPEPAEKIVIDTGDKARFSPGEPVVFHIAFRRNGECVPGVKFQLTLQRDFFPEEKSELLSAAEPVSFTTRLDRPGFARLAVSGGGLSAAWGAACEPEQIQAAPEVKGFENFWAVQKKRLLSVPLEVIRCRETAPDDAAYADKVECFDVQVACAGNAPVSACLALPRNAAPGSLPGYVFFHGAGVRPAFQPLPWAAMGLLALNVNAHGLPNDGSAEFFREMTDGPLKNYAARTYQRPEDSLFCDMALRVMRALEYLKSRPEWDGRTLIVHGGSQGGWQSLAALALDHDVTFGIIQAPAMCNLAGALEGRIPSWPYTVKPGVPAAAVRAALFCDGASFARHASPAAKAVFSAGWSDAAAVPSSIFAAFRNFPGEKVLMEYHDLGHERAVFWSGTDIVEDYLKKLES